ncbi:MAG: chromate efflux transporter [Pseudomonadota bacterium]
MSARLGEARPDKSPPALGSALPVWVKIGLLSFGGPAGQIALMQDEVVTKRGWIPSESFDRGLAFSMMLPGPEAQQLATWLGWRLHGLAGGLIAGSAFVVPGAALMLLLAWIAAAHGDIPLVAAIFAGIQPVVIALVLAALKKIADRSMKGPLHWALAAAAFISLWFLGLPFPLVIAAAALAGFLLPGQRSSTISAGRIPWAHVVGIIGAAVLLISTVFALAGGSTSPFGGVATLFTTAALVTFGGAYAVLPYVAGQAVQIYGWLGPADMLNGLAIAEATPGPLILVNTYAGFFAGWSHDSTVATALATGALATFYTFAPSFALILAFAPVVERLYQIAWARRALDGVSAAVVGVIANLVLFLAAASFFPIGWETPEWPKIVLFLISLPIVFWWKLGMLKLVGFGICAGVGLYLSGLG